MNLSNKEEFLSNSDTAESIIVVGTGPVGIKFIETLSSTKPQANIAIFGDEPWEPYNRVKLSSFFAGHVKWSDLSIGDNENNKKVVFHNNCSITSIDPDSHYVIDEFGKKHSYTKLVLATGSRPFIPNIKGVKLDNIFTFRSMTDIENLLARRAMSRKAVIIGGGVLGIEAAKAMTKQNTEVTIIDHSSFLMSSQLDQHASELLREYILSLGIKVLLNQGLKEFHGDGKVERILLADGRSFEFDTVILTAGISPNVELARDADLHVGKGIHVNDQMQTSNPDIYAIGECTEHRGMVYGIVKPGYEQAKVAAHSLSGKKSHYTGSLSATQIKVIDINVFSMGDISDVSPIDIKKEYIYEDSYKGIYRKIIVKTHRIIGAIAVGEWDELGRIQEAILNTRIIPPWTLIKFKNKGSLWPNTESNDISQWPAATVVCNCTGVTRGELSAEIKKGVDNLEQLCTNTGASTVCGSCKPHVDKLLTGSSTVTAAIGAKNLLALGFLTTLIMVLALILPAIPYASSVQVSWQWDMLWRENLFKQISGYTLLALSAIGLILSVNKRIKSFTYLSFPVWRIVHVVLGFIAVIGFAVHSGYRLGAGVNFFLALSFVSVLIAGGASSILVSLEHKIDSSLAWKLKQKIVWLHILAFWPFPALLATHIFKSYYF